MSFRFTSRPALVASRRLSLIASHTSRSDHLIHSQIPNLKPNTTAAPPSGSRRISQASSKMPPVPKTMKGVLINKTGGTEVLEYKTDIPVPTPIDGDILVKNDFLGVNFIDTYFRTGLYPASQFPYILGREGEGTIVAVGPGDTNGLSIGDKVVYMGERGYAELTSVKSSSAVKVPSSLQPGTAAAAFLQGLTALTLVREAHAVKKGDWVLVHAAAGGTGLNLCQFLRAIGANTIGTVSTPEKAKLAEENGATYTIIDPSYTPETIKARVMELTNNQGCIAIFDGVGASTFHLSLDCVARKGSVISFGNASGAVPPVNIQKLSVKNARLMRPTLFNFVTTREELTHYANELFGFIEKDGFNVKVHEVYPLTQVARAHEDLEGRKTTGKLLLDPSK
ncbi:hypothetical protein F4808DRAFT_433526 [Astrocystis sublimbata]|nr:hypothetical protein F4808DRAFT_433526 [Astrocystis sublimbata]